MTRLDDIAPEQVRALYAHLERDYQRYSADGGDADTVRDMRNELETLALMLSEKLGDET